MSNILSQEEINALLAEVLEEGAQSLEPDNATSSQNTYANENVNTPPSSVSSTYVATKHQRIVKYDFRRPNVFSKDHLRIIQGYHDNFSRLFTAALSVYLRQDIKLYLTYIEQHIYSEFIDEADEKSIYYIISFFNDQAIISLNIDVALLLIEKLLGGEGSKTNVDRNEFTEIEMAILGKLMSKMFEILKSCWGPLMAEIPQSIITEMNPKLIHLLPQNDPLLKLVFELVIGEHIGIITFCLPYVALEPFMDQIVAHQHIGQRTEKVNKEKELRHILNKIKIPLTANLGTITLPIIDVTNLAIGDVLTLNTRINDMIKLNVGPLEKFVGELGAYNKHLAVKILEIRQETQPFLEELTTKK